MRRFRILLALALVPLAAAIDLGNLPWAPYIMVARPGNFSATIAFVAPVYPGRSAISTYVANCTAEGEVLSARGEGSPLTVLGLSNGVEYACTVSASNAAGTSASSDTAWVTPKPDPSNSLAAGYRQAAWAPGMSVTFPNECNMTVWPNDRPSHAVDDFYLLPKAGGTLKGQDKEAPKTVVSAMPLEAVHFEGKTAQAPMQFNICPTRSTVPMAVNAGAIGVLISGSTLFGSAEIAGHRATTLNDNASTAFKNSVGSTVTARFIDHCNGHPTPANAGNIYHYHGLSDCVTAMVDKDGGPSHLLGVSLDGFPIYGDRDMRGQTVDPRSLDACNGITSATPEFPNGVYHYVLPSGVKEHNASMRCYGGALSRNALLVADSIGFCYAPIASNSAIPNGNMVMSKK